MLKSVKIWKNYLNESIEGKSPKLEHLLFKTRNGPNLHRPTANTIKNYNATHEIGVQEHGTTNWSLFRGHSGRMGRKHLGCQIKVHHLSV